MKVMPQIFFTILVIVIATSVVNAQPSLPVAPSQAPIDGGLGLLAAAGGAYAIKKLRNKKIDEFTSDNE